MAFIPRRHQSPPEITSEYGICVTNDRIGDAVNTDHMINEQSCHVVRRLTFFGMDEYCLFCEPIHDHLHRCVASLRRCRWTEADPLSSRRKYCSRVGWGLEEGSKVQTAHGKPPYFAGTRRSSASTPQTALAMPHLSKYCPTSNCVLVTPQCLATGES